MKNLLKIKIDINSIVNRNILILFVLFTITCSSESKSQNSISNRDTNADSVWKECKVNNITEICSVYIIDIENSDSNFKIISAKNDNLIKFRQDFNIKHNRDTIQIGKSYQLKLTKFFPTTDHNFFGDLITHIKYNDCIFKREFGVIYFTTECLEGLEIAPEFCK